VIHAGKRDYERKYHVYQNGPQSHFCTPQSSRRLFFRYQAQPKADAAVRSLPPREVVAAVVQEAYDKFKNETRGKHADDIPHLAEVDSKLCGIAIVTTDNQVVTKGHVTYSFSIQSIPKVYTLALAMEALGRTRSSKKSAPSQRGAPLTLQWRLWTCRHTPATPM